MKSFSKLPYRDNVACIVFKKDKFLLVQLQGWDKKFWKFPQGGLRKGESFKDAVKRELLEELGIKNFKIIGRSQRLNKYDWDEGTIKLAGSKWRGQIQRFFMVEFLGDEKEIKVLKGEIQDFKWVSWNELFEHINHDHQIFKGYAEAVKDAVHELLNSELLHLNESKNR